MSDHDFPDLNAFVTRVVHTPEVASVRLREGDNRARLRQVGRVTIDRETVTASELFKELQRRVATLHSTSPIHLEAMAVGDEQILDTCTAAPTLAKPSDDISLAAITAQGNLRLLESITQTAERDRWRLDDIEQRHAAERLVWHEERIGLLLELQELRHHQQIVELVNGSGSDEMKKKAYGTFLKVAEKAPALLLHLLTKKADAPKLTDQQAPPPADAAPAPAPAQGAQEAEEVTALAPASDDAPAAANTPEQDDEAAAFLELVHAFLEDRGPEAPEQIADFLLEELVALLQRNPNVLNLTRVQRLMPYIDGQVVMQAVMGG